MARVRRDARDGMSVHEVAEGLGVSDKAIYQAAKRGQFPVIYVGTRVIVSRVTYNRILAGELKITPEAA